MKSRLIEKQKIYIVMLYEEILEHYVCTKQRKYELNQTKVCSYGQLW